MAKQQWLSGIEPNVSFWFLKGTPGIMSLSFPFVWALYDGGTLESKALGRHEELVIKLLELHFLHGHCMCVHHEKALQEPIVNLRDVVDLHNGHSHLKRGNSGTWNCDWIPLGIK